MLRTLSTIGATFTGIIDVGRAKLSRIFRFNFLNVVAFEETLVVMVGVPDESTFVPVPALYVCAGSVGTQSQACS